jgi:hypothetical protein
MKEIKIGTRYIWVEKEKPIVKGIVVDIVKYHNDQENVKIQWYEDLTWITRGPVINYHKDMIISESRIQIDKEYYREMKLRELGI